MTGLSHREACYELRRSAKLLSAGKVTRGEWFESVARILSAREYGVQPNQPEQTTMTDERASEPRTNTRPGTQHRATARTRAHQAGRAAETAG